ncbi:MAG: hypothetical protein VXA43_02070, partial [Candidatus Poseidoniales archaeon]
MVAQSHGQRCGLQEVLRLNGGFCRFGHLFSFSNWKCRFVVLGAVHVNRLQCAGFRSDTAWAVWKCDTPVLQ